MVEGEASAEKSTSRVASTWKSVREGWPPAATVRATLHHSTPRVGAGTTHQTHQKPEVEVLDTSPVLVAQKGRKDRPSAMQNIRSSGSMTASIAL